MNSKMSWADLRQWDELPEFMKNLEVKQYYFKLQKKEKQLKLKRVNDIVLSSFLIVLLLPVMLIIAVCIYKDSPGEILFRQKRVTQYGRIFEIYKFRTMVVNADKIGPSITGMQDNRITKVGSILRKSRLDELPQLFNVLVGDMTFVGTRPEVPCYVKKYTGKMRATLLLPAGVTSLASIKFRDEAEMLEGASDIELVYVNKILPKKMQWNLWYIRNFNILEDWGIMVKTVLAVLK